MGACTRRSTRSVADARAVERLADLLLDGWEAQRLRGGYKRLPTTFVAAVHALVTADGTETAERRLSALLLHLLDRAPEIERRPHRSHLPQSARDALARSRERIRREHACGAPPGAASLARDAYLKDLAVAVLKMLPGGGAQLFDLNCGVPRRWLLPSRQRSLHAATSLAAYVLVRCGGSRPAIEMHTCDASLEDFTPEGWRRCYRVLVDLFAANPELRAALASGWLYDPALATISPRLEYVRGDPWRAGARTVPLGPSAKATANALAKSPTRRAAVAAGCYVPVDHLIVWSRADILAYGRSLA